MKKISIIALMLVATLSLAACGRRDEPDTTPTTTAPTTEMTIFPSTDPIIETNIPDPSVDTSMPDMTDMIDGMDGTDNTTTN
ncbi:MAG: hypothetical protein J6Q92_01460 [Oscillospiraceae bacterium]|nr:hypothetical protein [Oscillospiraceae bacterium]